MDFRQAFPAQSPAGKLHGPVELLRQLHGPRALRRCRKPMRETPREVEDGEVICPSCPWMGYIMVTLWLHYGDIMVTLGDIPKYLKYLQMMSFARSHHFFLGVSHFVQKQRLQGMR